MARGRRRAGRGTSTQPLTQTLAPGRRASRASRRERRQRQRRRRVLSGSGLVAAVVVVALLVLVGGAVRSRTHAPKARPRTQRTLLFLMSTPERSARAAVLMAYDPAPKTGVVVLVPPHTLADVAGLGDVVLASAIRLGGSATAREAVADLLGVVVDNSWSVTTTAFGALVDRAGGVVVDVDVDVVQSVRGGRRILLRAGPQQRLGGPLAVAYATYVAHGENEVAAQARLQRVLEALLAALPADPAAIGTSVTALGSGSLSTMPAASLGTFLDGLRDTTSGDAYSPQVLPVTPIDTGGGAIAFSAKTDDVSTMVHTLLADSLPPSRDVTGNRVLVENGVGTPGIGASVARRLRSSPYRIVGTRNKQGFGVARSAVVLFDSSDASLAKGREVAALLRLPASAVVLSTQAQSVADIIVVIGRDYRP